MLCIVGFACTDLNAPVYDKKATFWRNESEIEAGVAAAYVGLRSYWDFASIYSLNEASSDEIIVPTRGTDWNDNTVWEQLWKHTWDANTPMLDYVWVKIYIGIDNINLMLESLQQLSPAPKNLVLLVAELKTLRAFYYFHALDLFGNVPIITSYYNSTGQLGPRSRAELFAFVEKELKDNLTNLPTDKNALTYGRVTQWFTQTLLAKLYLNAEVYIGTTRWADCIQACDAVLSSNRYLLETNFFSNFLINNENSGENIFVIPFDTNNGLYYFGIQGFTLHYNSGKTFGLNSGGFNGWCSTEEYYKLFDPNDIRRNMFLVGQQYVNQIPDAQHIQYDNLGNLLIFDPVITSFHLQPPKTETAGARCAKWEFNKQSSFGAMSNDFSLFRLADIILMKAEAQFRSGDAAGALTTLNQKVSGVSIRSRTGLPDFSAAEMNLDGLLAERARELSWEGHRRTDMIRCGRFLNARIPDKDVSADFRILYPIPQSEINKNKKLTQNPGY